MELTTEQKLRKAVIGLAKGASLIEQKNPYVGHPTYVPEGSENITESQKICNFISSITKRTVFLRFNGEYYTVDDKNCIKL